MAGVLNLNVCELGTTQPTQPGVGGISQQDAMAYGQPVPGQPGVFVDPRTGQQFMLDANGQPQVIQAQNLSQQTVTNTGNSQQQQQQAALLQQQQQQTLAQQNGLASNLTNTINGTGGPSAADIQLGQGLNQIQGQGLAQAAGATGENAAAARRTAAQAGAGAAVATNGQAGLQRAQEVQAAQQGLAGVLNNKNQTLSTGINTASGTGLGYANTAAGVQGTNAQLLEDEQKANAKQNSGLLGSIGNAASSIGAML